MSIFELSPPVLTDREFWVLLKIRWDGSDLFWKKLYYHDGNWTITFSNTSSLEHNWSCACLWCNHSSNCCSSSSVKYLGFPAFSLAFPLPSLHKYLLKYFSSSENLWATLFCDSPGLLSKYWWARSARILRSTSIFPGLLGTNFFLISAALARKVACLVGLDDWVALDEWEPSLGTDLGGVLGVGMVRKGWNPLVAIFAEIASFIHH